MKTIHIRRVVEGDATWYFPSEDIHGGDYVLASEAEAKIVRLREALECIRDGEMFDNKLFCADIARAALAQVREERDECRD